MNAKGGNGKLKDVVDDVDDVEDDDTEFAASPDDTVVITEDVDDLDGDADISAELNVEELVAKLDSDVSAQRRKEIRRRLEELEEQRRAARELDSTFNFNLDDDI